MHAAEGGLLFDHMATPEGLDIPPIFEEAFLNETVLSIGAAGAGLPFHNHATAWQSVSICVIYHRIAMTVAVHNIEPILQHYDDA